MGPFLTRRTVLRALIAGAVALPLIFQQATLAQNAETAISHASLSGTLLRPANATTAVLIIAGSGPTDRDGNHAGGKTDAYRLLADGLAKVGIASLRYDKRGLPASRLDAKGGEVKEEQLTIQTYADDVVSLTAWLKSQGFKRVVLVGHSEGALVALMAANTAEPDRVVLLNPAGFPLGQVLRKQFTRQPMPEDMMEEIERVLSALEKGSDPGAIKPPVDRFFRASAQPFLKSVLALDPVTLLKGTTTPVLLISGGHDLQVGRLDQEELKAARGGIRVHWEPRLTHMLKAVLEDDPAQVKVYTDPSLPVMPELVDVIAKFANEP